MKNLTAQQIDQLATKVHRRLKAGNQSAALKILQNNGFDAEAAMLRQPPQQLVQHDLQCPAHGQTVAASCQMQTCKFWVRSDMANNCLLAYCAHQQIDRLSSDEIAYLYGQPVREVRGELDQALTVLRQTAIQSDAANDPDVQRVFWFVETTSVCAVCGSTTDESLILVPGTPLAYCSKECAEETPPDVLACEHRFGRPVGTLLRWAIRRFRNLPVMEKTLGLKRETLIELSRRYLGRELGVFFPKVKMQSERPPWRRRGNRAEVSSTVEALRAHTAAQSGTFGAAIFGVDDLRKRLHEVLV